MAVKSAVPGFFERRDLIYAEQPDVPALRAQGQGLVEAGLLEPALESFVKAGDAEGISRVAAAAASGGDAFAYEAALKAQGKAATAAEWTALAETALTAGRLWFAYRAFEKADHQEGLERTRQAMFHAAITPPEAR